MSTESTNTRFELAYRFVTETRSPVYLTGKAGTGKTTFLNYVREHCSKQMVVVAPTGVAAINAGGVTMHSFFQLPLAPYVPSQPIGFEGFSRAVDRHSLLRNLRFSKEKRKLIRELELLVIDEVSMLRSDMLDAMDTILQHVRQDDAPFGGIQVLFIGDLYQLPPVVQSDDEALLNAHYRSPFFFDAYVFQQVAPVYIELNQIYRQSDDTFISLLNNVRNHCLGARDYELLEARFQPDFRDTSGRYITLCSHNRQADAINQRELEALPGELFTYSGEIRDDFGENLLPTDRVLRLKVGAQVMFIRNDQSAEKLYYNGKIARITELQQDRIVVQLPGSNETMEVGQETWNQLTYIYDAESGETQQKILGQFIQYPLRLAWAVTIHKSQGLTFSHAVLDAGSSFAPGQVYVALSRCTSLEGIVLRSRITPASLHVDERLARSAFSEAPEAALQVNLETAREQYQAEQVRRLFLWMPLLDVAVLYRQELLGRAGAGGREAALQLASELIDKLSMQLDFATKFLTELGTIAQLPGKDSRRAQLVERAQHAVRFFADRLLLDLLPRLQTPEPVQGKVSKSESEARAMLLSMVQQKLEHFSRAQCWGEPLWTGDPLPVHAREGWKPAAANRSKKKKGDSARETYILFLAGKSAPEIAVIRKLALSTIEGHLLHFVMAGELDIFLFLTLEQVEEIYKTHEAHPEFNTTELKNHMEGRYSYNQIRMALYYAGQEQSSV